MKLRYNIAYCCFSLLGLFVITGCNASKSESAGESTGNGAAAQSQTADSAIQANTETEMSNPQPPGPAPAPGTVHVTAEILSTEAEENEYRCTLRIISVEAYGVGTRPLQPDTEITAFARKKVVESANNPILPPNDDQQSASAPRVKRTIVLKFQQMPNLAGLQARTWRILSIQ